MQSTGTASLLWVFASQLQLLWESMFVHWTSAGETRPEAGLEDSGWAKEHVKKSLVSRAMCCACFLFQHWHCTRKLVSLLSSLENLVRKIIVVKLQITYFLPPMDKNVIWEVGGFSIKMANFQFFSEIFLYLWSVGRVHNDQPELTCCYLYWQKYFWWNILLSTGRMRSILTLARGKASAGSPGWQRM